MIRMPRDHCYRDCQSTKAAHAIALLYNRGATNAFYDGSRVPDYAPMRFNVINAHRDRLIIAKENSSQDYDFNKITRTININLQ